MFDLENAIENAIAERGRDRAFERLQEEGKKAIRVDSLRAMQALGSIQIAETALTHKLTREQQDFEYNRMADGYYFLGNFTQALQLTRDPVKREEYEKAVNASQTPCQCPLTFGNDAKGRRVEINPRFLVDQFPGKNLYKCSHCSRYYVTPSS